MPNTSDGRTVYADPARCERYVQTSPEVFSLSTSGSPSEWREFLEDLQAQAKARIDSFTDRDFEHHQGETVSISREAGNNAFYIPNPVINVSEVTINGDVIDAENYRIKDSGMLIFPDRDYISRYLALGSDDSGLNEDPNYEYGEYGDDVYGYEDIIEITLDHGYQTPPEHIVTAELQLVAHSVIRLSDMAEEAVMEQEEPSMSGGLLDNMPQETRQILRREEKQEMFI